MSTMIIGKKDEAARVAHTLSPERKGRITASRVGAILGVSKWSTPDDVLRDMVDDYQGNAKRFAGNVATRWGHDHEHLCVNAYMALTGNVVSGVGSDQTFVAHPEYDFLGVTPDGFVGDDGLLECKCPYKSNYTSIKEHPDYEAQVQLQMACADRQWCDFAIWREGEPLIVERVKRDDGWLDRVMPELMAFMERFEAAKDKPLGAKEDDRTDGAWRDAVERYKAATKAMDEAKAAQDVALGEMQALAPAGGKGFGITFSVVERAGSISYASVVKKLLPDADLEPYRGSPSLYYRVSVDK